MIRQMVSVQGKRYALVEPAELRKLEKLAAKAETTVLPPWPPADADGNRPALEFTRVSIARSIIEERRALGLSQLDLAKLAGLRQETVSRLESGQHTPTIRTVDKIDQALKQAARSVSKARDNTLVPTKKRRK